MRLGLTHLLLLRTRRLPPILVAKLFYLSRKKKRRRNTMFQCDSTRRRTNLSVFVSISMPPQWLFAFRSIVFLLSSMISEVPANELPHSVNSAIRRGGTQLYWKKRDYFDNFVLSVLSLKLRLSSLAFFGDTYLILVLLLLFPTLVKSLPWLMYRTIPLFSKASNSSPAFANTISSRQVFEDVVFAITLTFFGETASTTSSSESRLLVGKNPNSLTLSSAFPIASFASWAVKSFYYYPLLDICCCYYYLFIYFCGW